MHSSDLQDVLATKGLTRQAAADMAHVNIRTVFRWLNGTTPIPVSVAELLALKTSFLPDAAIAEDSTSSE